MYYQGSIKGFRLLAYLVKDRLKQIKHTVNIHSIEHLSSHITNQTSAYSIY